MCHLKKRQIYIQIVDLIAFIGVSLFIQGVMAKKTPQFLLMKIERVL